MIIAIHATLSPMSLQIDYGNRLSRRIGHSMSEDAPRLDMTAAPASASPPSSSRPPASVAGASDLQVCSNVSTQAFKWAQFVMVLMKELRLDDPESVGLPRQNRQRGERTPCARTARREALEVEADEEEAKADQESAKEVTSHQSSLRARISSRRNHPTSSREHVTVAFSDNVGNVVSVHHVRGPREVKPFKRPKKQQPKPAEQPKK
ncbi:hypothetical protein OCS_02788 [Ophiocordyceps sinensis CO18]|uniref:Uncharacterized protein n=1 Tax=Ophiocordyceps sinensis (strain Co18 / CGMCC 3.14243) TaxID=911162 RepID=T5AIA6_OPHSC|nr:hypothetical protein OCS_02788 [Ophiocordyceps sinensis CO18]